MRGCGYVYDSECDLYYLQSRYYDPSMGRFLNADVYVSTGQGILGHNMLAYCNNNPVNFSDPTGTFLIEITLTAAGTVACVTIFGLMCIQLGAPILCDVLNWLSRQWFFEFSRIVYKTAPEKEQKIEQKKEKKKLKKKEPPTPDVTYPGDDPTKAPDGYEWKGPDAQGGKRGGYKNPNGRDSWHPDLDHSGDIKPHWDYNDGFGHKWRVFPDHIEYVPK